MSEVEEAPVKLGETLASLIERGGYSRNRQKILDAVGVSAAALSQYTRGQTRPSFERLVALARFFDVSLDHLVFGHRPTPIVETGPVPAVIELALADVQARTSRHSALVRRIVQVLADRIDAVAGELAAAPHAPREGLMQNDDLIRLEQHSRAVDIVTDSLEYDVLEIGEDIAVGLFFTTVSRNLRKGRPYRFMLVDEPALERVEHFRRLLIRDVGGDAAQLCEFRRADSPMVVSFGLYDLDLVGLRLEDPVLAETIHEHVGASGDLGYVVGPNAETQADVLMSGRQRARARTAFEGEWRRARAV